MLLRRVTEHVKQQNWFAVGLDFLIVIVGVFIGIQVANWNEARLQSERDEILLARLAADFEIIVKRGKERAPLIAAGPASTAQLIKIIRSGQQPELDSSIQALLKDSFLPMSEAPQSATYEELLAAGGLSRIENEALRDSLNLFAEAQQKSSDSLMGQMSFAMNNYKLILQAVRYETNALEFRQSYIPQSVDWKEFEKAEPYLIEHWRWQLLRKQWFDTALKEARNVLELIRSDSRFHKARQEATVDSGGSESAREDV